ncbi:hypothetical protein SM983_00815, partial [Escherichia coli]|nr:hypothetical protein [Escherichia coli]
GTADRNRSHWSTSKTPSYTKSVSWQHHLATAIGSLASFACVSFGFPVILVGGAILLTGIVCTVVLNEIDAQCHLSEKLKYAIRDGLKRQQELDKWKRENMTPFMYVLNTPPVI